MSWSRAEISALATRAARGAGAGAGQAALFGQAAALHLGQGRAADVLSEALEALPEGPITTLPLVLQRMWPAAQTPGEVQWAGDRDLARSYLETLPGRCIFLPGGDGRLRLTFEVCEERPPLQRVTGCEALMAQMTEFAARTLVPESAASRISGAGAGLSDND